MKNKKVKEKVLVQS